MRSVPAKKRNNALIAAAVIAVLTLVGLIWLIMSWRFEMPVNTRKVTKLYFADNLSEAHRQQ